jgi:hypothetical protein
LREEKFKSKVNLRKNTIRAYYYNACLFQMSEEEDNVMEMTEFIFQDLKGGIPPSLMNSALPAGYHLKLYIILIILKIKLNDK